MSNPRGVNTSSVSIEEAKAVYNSLLHPTDQGVVDAFRAVGKKVDHRLVGKWRRKGWVHGKHLPNTASGEEERVLAASRELDSAVPTVTGDAMSRTHDLSAQMRQQLAEMPLAQKIQMVLDMNANCLIRIQQILEIKLAVMMETKATELVALQTVCVKNAAILAEANRINRADAMKLIEATPRNGRMPDTIDNHPFAAELAVFDAVE